MQPLTVEDLAAMIRAMHEELREKTKADTDFQRTLILLVNQSGDITHASVETAARIKCCSVSTIKRRIQSREYTLEVIPGKRISGIPIEQLSAAWVPIAVAKRAHERRKLEIAKYGSTPHK